MGLGRKISWNPAWWTPRMFSIMGNFMIPNKPNPHRNSEECSLHCSNSGCVLNRISKHPLCQSSIKCLTIRITSVICRFASCWRQNFFSGHQLHPLVLHNKKKITLIQRCSWNLGSVGPSNWVYNSNKWLRQPCLGGTYESFTYTYCWWLKSCTWDAWNPKNNGINYQTQLVSRISKASTVLQLITPTVRDLNILKRSPKAILFLKRPLTLIPHQDACHVPKWRAVFRCPGKGSGIPWIYHLVTVTNEGL